MVFNDGQPFTCSLIRRSALMRLGHGALSSPTSSSQANNLAVLKDWNITPMELDVLGTIFTSI